jgi:hypothetical protein
MAAKRSRSDTARDLRDRLGDSGGYTAFHLPRYAYLLEILDRELSGREPRVVLDVGLSAFVIVLRERYSQRVDTLDLIPAEGGPRGYQQEGAQSGEHFVFDLNQLEGGHVKPPNMPRYDVVLFCEVLEHLRLSPRYVFRFLESLLKPTGVLVVQTPNAAAIGKRVKLMAGRNPYGLIGEDPRNPLHFREYTLEELRMFGAEVGLAITSSSFAGYFDVRYRHGGGRSPLVSGLTRIANRLAPPRWRPGMTVVFRRGGASRPASAAQPPP